jgi:hypothetical protein
MSWLNTPLRQAYGDATNVLHRPADHGFGFVSEPLTGDFFSPAVGAVTDRRQHGKRQHHQRDMAVPTMPGTGLVMVETEFGLRRLKAILNRPALRL